MTRAEYPREVYSIESFGGTGGFVTGSCHKLVVKDASGRENKIVVDCGMFQGWSEERSDRGVRRNFQPISALAKDVTEFLVSHAHIDHTGRLPIIYKNGFSPTILATVETAAFMEPMLRNSAQIQGQENPQNRLYDMWDVDNTLRHVKAVPSFTQKNIGQKQSGLTAEFLPNGHVMGSASILVRSRDGRKNILFTGDMGKPDQSLCGGYRDFVDRYTDHSVKAIVVESTSFDKTPVSFEEKKRGFIETINRAWKNGGNPVFPTLSFHRAQEIIEIIHNSQLSGEIPADCQVIIDAPLAVELKEVFKKLGVRYLSKRYGNDPNYYKNDNDSINRFDLKNAIVIDSHQQSLATDKTMANYPGKMIILASGGMGGHGRSVNYLRGNFGKNPKNIVALTCFQVAGTEGANLLQKSKVLNGKNTGASVVLINGFTSHASGPREVFGFLERFNLGQLENIIITHGRDPARKAMAEEFKRRGYPGQILLPEMNQVVEI